MYQEKGDRNLSKATSRLKERLRQKGYSEKEIEEFIESFL